MHQKVEGAGVEVGGGRGRERGGRWKGREKRWVEVRSDHSRRGRNGHRPCHTLLGMSRGTTKGGEGKIRSVDRGGEISHFQNKTGGTGLEDGVRCEEG